MCAPGKTCKQLGLHDLNYRMCVIVASPEVAAVFDTPFGGPRKSFCTRKSNGGPPPWIFSNFGKQPGTGEQCVSKFLTQKRQYKRYAKGCSYNPKPRKSSDVGSLVWNGAGGKNGNFGKAKTSKKGNKHYRPLCCKDKKLCQEWEENYYGGYEYGYAPYYLE